MNYNIEEIRKILKGFNPEHFTDMDYDLIDIIDAHTSTNEKDNWSWESGATKAVIISKNKDYVLKVPFDGWYDSSEDECSIIFKYFYNGGGCEGWDYCELENEYYNNIVKGTKFEKYFICPKLIDVSEWPVYIQEKVEVYADIINPLTLSREEDRKTVKNSKKVQEVSNLPIPWLAVVLEKMGNNIEEFEEFITFIHDNFSDLHRGNIGFLNGNPVIIDFGGFDEEQEVRISSDQEENISF